MSIFYPVELFANWLTYNIFSLSHGNRLAESLNFFIFDTIKILILVTVIIFIVSVIRSFLPKEKVKAILSHKYPFTGNILAALLGIITPFCTCSAIPLFLGFIEAGVPIGVTFSFLVASPMINEVALIMLLGMFGWKIALIYIGSGLLIAIFSGIIIGKLKVESLIENLEYQNKTSKNESRISWQGRFRYAKRYTSNILKKIWPYVLVGVGLGALIHGYVPTDFLARYAGADKWYAVPLATILGIPLYSNVAGIIPLVSVLTEKGVAIGTTLAFMMAVTGLSLPEFMILRKVMKPKLILIFAGIVGIGIIITGYLFNYFLT